MQTALPHANNSMNAVEVAEALGRWGVLLIACAGVSMAEVKDYFLGLTRGLGRIIPDDSTPQGWYRMTDKGSDANPAFYADRPDHLPLHTDRAFSPAPPPVMGLLCETPAAWGGESLLVDARRLYLDLLSGFGPEGLTSLFEDFYSIRRAPHETRRPLFFFNGSGHTCIAYRRDDDAVEVCYPPRFDAPVQWISDYLSNPRNQLRVKLQAGEILLVDNHRYLHGRTAFQAKRLLYRLYFAADSEAGLLTGFTGDANVDREVRRRGLDRWSRLNANDLPDRI